MHFIEQCVSSRHAKNSTGPDHVSRASIVQYDTHSTNL